MIGRSSTTQRVSGGHPHRTGRGTANMQPGAVFAQRFRIEALIGEGGIGRVYRARDLRTNAPVAIKRLRVEYARDPEAKARFVREAEVMERLPHPNIIQVYGHGEDAEALPYMAMELITGEPLSEWREREGVLGEVLLLMDQVLGALGFCHRSGVVHRDVKPENIVILPPAAPGLAPVAKLLDFGFALDLRTSKSGGGSKKAQTDAFGTPLYMAPEMAAGKGELGPGVDIYAVGVILFEFIAGRPPFTGAHGMAVAIKHLMEPVPVLEPRVGTSVPKGLIEIVYRAMQKAPADRFQTAGTMQAALANFHTRGPAWSREPAPRPVRLTPAAPDAAALIAQVVGEAAVRAVRVSRPPVVKRPAAPLAHLAEPVVERQQVRSVPAGRVDPPTPGSSRRSVAPPRTTASSSTNGPRQTASPCAAEVAPRVVGRDQDLMWLWDRARGVCERGGCKVVLIGGEPGQGASTLARWLRQQITAGGWMLSLGGGSRHAARHGGGLRGALDDLFGELPSERAGAEALMRDTVARWSQISDRSDSQAQTVSALLSYLRPRGPVSLLSTEPAPRELGGEVLNARIIETMRLASMERPLLLSFEGLDSDGELAGFLVQLLEAATQRRISVLAVVTFALDYNRRPVREVRAALARIQAAGEAAVELLELSPLDPSVIGALLEIWGPVGPRLAALVTTECRGNPLHAKELLGLLTQTGQARRVEGCLELEHLSSRALPGRLEEVMLGRAHTTIARLPESATAVRALRQAALLGESFERSLLKHLLLRGEGAREGARQGIEGLLSVGLLVAVGDGEVLRFAHGALRAGVLGALAQEEDTAQLHGLVAESIVAWAGDEVDRHAESIADHFARAGRSLEAARYLVITGRAARAQRQAAKALGLFERSDALLEPLVGLDAELERATLWLELAGLERARGATDRALLLAERTLDWAAHAQRDALGARAALFLADLSRMAGDRVGAVAGYGRAARLFGAAGDQRGLARGLMGIGLVERDLGRPEAAAQALERARMIMLGVGDPAGVGRVARALGELAFVAGRIADARRWFDEAMSGFQKAGEPGVYAQVAWFAGEAAAKAHDWDDALRCYGVARSEFAAAGDRAGLGRSHRSLARAWLGRGEWRAAAQHFEQALATVSAPTLWAERIALMAEAGAAALDAEDWGVAGRYLVGGADEAKAAGDGATAALLWAKGALAHGKQGDLGAMQAHVNRALTVSGDSSMADAGLAEALEALATFDAGRGDRPRAERLYAFAADMYTRAGRCDAAHEAERRGQWLAGSCSR